jgi:hypothetical protein
MTSWWKTVNAGLNMAGEVVSGWDDGCSGGMAVVSVRILALLISGEHYSRRRV